MPDGKIFLSVHCTLPHMKDIPVLHEDTDILVVNKPCGIPVQGGAGITVSIIDILNRQTGSKVYPVHRLDRDTAGILMIARNPAAASRLTRLIGSRDIIKKYTALCHKTPQKPEGLITIPVGRGRDRKPAETRYQVISSAADCSLIQAELGTGRTHQIRIHLASIGCPVLADDKYGNFAQNRVVRKEFGIRKLQLAATELILPAGMNMPVHFTIPLPVHMADAAAVLGLTEAYHLDTI